MLAMTDKVVVLLRNRCSGMIGSEARDSTNTARARISRLPMTRAKESAEVHSKFLPARVTQISRMLTPVAIRVAPR